LLKPSKLLCMGKRYTFMWVFKINNLCWAGFKPIGNGFSFFKIWFPCSLDSFISPHSKRGFSRDSHFIKAFDMVLSIIKSCIFKSFFGDKDHFVRGWEIVCAMERSDVVKLSCYIPKVIIASNILRLFFVLIPVITFFPSIIILCFNSTSPLCRFNSTYENPLRVFIVYYRSRFPCVIYQISCLRLIASSKSRVPIFNFWFFINI